MIIWNISDDAQINNSNKDIIEISIYLYVLFV
jgi:hypothetical protein